MKIFANCVNASKLSVLIKEFPWNLCYIFPAHGIELFFESAKQA